VHAIGPDAVTVRQSAVAGSDIARLESLPRGSDLIGRKVVSEDGRFLGKVSDVLIDRTDGRILGYLLAEHTPGSRFEEMLGKDKNPREMPYLPADAKLRAGRDLLVASEDAVNYDWTDEDEDVAAEHAAGGVPVNSRWGYAPPPGSSAPTRRKTGPEAVLKLAEARSSATLRFSPVVSIPIFSVPPVSSITSALEPSTFFMGLRDNPEPAAADFDFSRHSSVRVSAERPRHTRNLTPIGATGE
jgi:sporulation protein YlmC with PRC-barrel domain